MNSVRFGGIFRSLFNSGAPKTFSRTSGKWGQNHSTQARTYGAAIIQHGNGDTTIIPPANPKHRRLVNDLIAKRESPPSPPGD